MGCQKCSNLAKIRHVALFGGPKHVRKHKNEVKNMKFMSKNMKFMSKMAGSLPKPSKNGPYQAAWIGTPKTGIFAKKTRYVTSFDSFLTFYDTIFHILCHNFHILCHKCHILDPPKNTTCRILAKLSHFGYPNWNSGCYFRQHLME